MSPLPCPCVSVARVPPFSSTRDASPTTDPFLPIRAYARSILCRNFSLWIAEFGWIQWFDSGDSLCCHFIQLGFCFFSYSLFLMIKQSNNFHVLVATTVRTIQVLAAVEVLKRGHTCVIFADNSGLMWIRCRTKNTESAYKRESLMEFIHPACQTNTMDWPKRNLRLLSVNEGYGCVEMHPLNVLFFIFMYKREGKTF